MADSLKVWAKTAGISIAFSLECTSDNSQGETKTLIRWMFYSVTFYLKTTYKFKHSFLQEHIHAPLCT